MRNAIAAIALAGTLMFGGTACGDWPQACEGLSISQQDVDAAANGYEVEKQDSSGNTCELSQDGTSWSVDD